MGLINLNFPSILAHLIVIFTLQLFSFQTSYHICLLSEGKKLYLVLIEARGIRGDDDILLAQEATEITKGRG